MCHVKRVVKIGIVILIASVIVIVAVNADILFNFDRDMKNVGTNTFYPEIELFTGVFFELTTDKSVYVVGEDVAITATLNNTNDESVTIYCSGIINKTSNERYTYFGYNAYNEEDAIIWTGKPYPDDFYEILFNTLNNTENYDPPNQYKPLVYLGNATSDYNITINASSTYSHTFIWDQHYGEDIGDLLAHLQNEPVPAGTYHISGKFGVNWKHYYGNEAFPAKTWGNTTTIVIEEA